MVIEIVYGDLMMNNVIFKTLNNALRHDMPDKSSHQQGSFPEAYETQLLNIHTHIYENSQAKLRKGSSYIRKNIKTHPERRLGTLTFIRFRICRAIVSTMANLPSLPCGAPVSIDLRLSLSARQAVSKELSGPTDPDCAEAIATDCPIKAIQEISDAFGGPWFDMRA